MFYRANKRCYRYQRQICGSEAADLIVRHPVVLPGKEEEVGTESTPDDREEVNKAASSTSYGREKNSSCPVGRHGNQCEWMVGLLNGWMGRRIDELIDWWIDDWFWNLNG